MSNPHGTSASLMLSSRWILCLATIFLLTAAALRPPVRQQELRVLITGRNMVEQRDPLHLEFQNQPRYRKPPMPYWASALSFAVTGGRHSVFPGRLPFVAATLLILYLMMRLSGQNGVRTGVFLLFTFGIWRFGVLAETDLLNLLGMVIAFTGWERNSAALSATGLATAFLSKGPAGLAIPLISFLILQSENPHRVRYWLGTTIPAFFAAGAWTSFLLKTPESREALANELHGTFLGSAHINPPVYYLYTLPLLFLPALLFLLVSRKNWRPSRISTTPVVWFAVTFVLLTLTMSKQNHYALMLMPPAAWILAEFSKDLPIQKYKRGLLILGLLATLAEIPRSRYEPHALNARFLSRARPEVADAPMLHVVGVNSARFDFHLGRHVENTDSATHALNRAAPGDAILVVQHPENFDARDHANPPVMEADDARWIRRMYRVP